MGRIGRIGNGTDPVADRIAGQCHLVLEPFDPHRLGKTERHNIGEAGKRVVGPPEHRIGIVQNARDTA